MGSQVCIYFIKKMMNVLLIGGSGFVGTHLISTLKDFYNVTNLDKNQSRFYPDITIIGDVRDKDILKKELKGKDIVILLAAEHRDDVSPVNLYYDVNVEGTKNVLEAMDFNDVRTLIFTSSVAIYGLNKNCPDENHCADPFNHYGKSKWQAEEILRDWYNKDQIKRTLTILRPTVIFGERNRGNVYNLLSQISSRRFLMVGKGDNYKSMAYVGNISAFIKYCLDSINNGYKVFNYVDKPDFNMNELINQVETSLNKKVSGIRLPYFIGILGGLFFDLLARISRRKLAISSVRIKKFCATTQFNATAVIESGFLPPYSLSEGLHRTLYYEFLDPDKDDVEFITE